MKKIILLLMAIINFSCSKEDVIEDPVVPTELKGHVSDNIRGLNISGYKIVLVKSWESCSNWACGLTLQEIGTAYTNVNGDYSIKFNYRLNPGESYGISEQYYGFPYYPEYLASSSGGGIKAGQTNVININAFKPILLKLNLQVLNNNNAPLRVRNEIDNSTNSFLNTENIYEQNVTKTYFLNSRPDTDIKIIFWYYAGTNAVQTLHKKIFLHHTTLDEVDTLNYTVDCATF